MSTCASRKSPPSVRTLAWLGLVAKPVPVSVSSFLLIQHGVYLTTLNKYCYCWRNEVVISSNLAVSHIGDPDDEGRNNAGLPSHNASWTRHYTTLVTPVKKEETTPDCPATMPRGPGTPPLSRTRLPTTASIARAPDSAELLQKTEDLSSQVATLSSGRTRHRPHSRDRIKAIPGQGAKVYSTALLPPVGKRQQQALMVADACFTLHRPTTNRSTGNSQRFSGQQATQDGLLAYSLAGSHASPDSRLCRTDSSPTASPDLTPLWTTGLTGQTRSPAACRIFAHLQTTSCPGRSLPPAAPPDRSVHLHRPTTQAPKRQ